jgi:hypothetical protein
VPEQWNPADPTIVSDEKLPGFERGFRADARCAGTAGLFEAFRQARALRRGLLGKRTGVVVTSNARSPSPWSPETR